MAFDKLKHASSYHKPIEEVDGTDLNDVSEFLTNNGLAQLDDDFEDMAYQAVNSATLRDAKTTAPKWHDRLIGKIGQAMKQVE